MLTATDKWKAAARAGTVLPVVLMELQPTVLSAESSRQNDWQDVASSSDINLSHSSGELVLASERIAYGSEQPVSNQLEHTFFRNADYEESAVRSSAKDNYSEIGQFLQTVKVDSGFRLLELWIGVKAMYIDGASAFNGKLIVRLFSGLAEPSSRIQFPGAEYHSPSAQRAASDIYSRAEHVLTLEADFGETFIQGARYELLNGNIFMVWDISDRYLFIAGEQICSLDLMVDRATGAQHVKLFGAAGGNAYADGQLYEHNHLRGHSYEKPADLGFRFITEGYSSSGTVTFEFDMGQAPDTDHQGSVELSYCEPAGTTVSARVREKPQGGAWGAWEPAQDGHQLTGKRYTQVELTLTASSDGLRTPLIYSVKAAYRRIERFVLADESIDGYPHILLNAPSYSAKGNPLEGTADRSDTLAVQLADPSGMISANLFGQFNLKNDPASFSLGFKGLPVDDYLPLKSLWVEDWEPFEGYVKVILFDRLSRFFNEDVPNVNELDPALTEQIHFDGELPGAIKRQLFARAGSRPSQINDDSLAALDAKFPWQLEHAIEEPTEPEKICKQLNRHLLAFEFNDEAGQWRTPFVDFSASPVATIEASEILTASEKYTPGMRSVKNEVVVFVGGTGDKENDYEQSVISVDTESVETYKEIRVDKLLSEFIPCSDDPGNVDGMASIVGRNRLYLQRDGERSISFSTHLLYAPLQTGDHIQLNSNSYVRAGSSNPNPLLVIITSKHIAPTLSRINFAAIVLLDSDQTVPGAVEIGPPQNVQAVDNGNGTATISWDKSTTDNGSNIARYLIYRRRWSLLNWGAPVAEVTADGSASYSKIDSDHRNTLAYDFGVRAVHKNGRVSRLIEVEKIQITNNLPAAPTWQLIPVAGGWGINITANVTGALEYRVYRYHGPTATWLREGDIAAPAWSSANAKVKEGFYNFKAWVPKLGSGFGRFKLSSVNSWGESTLSAEQKGYALPYEGTVLAADSIAPTLPDESSTWPKLTRIQQADGSFSYYAELKVVLPDGYEDMARLVQLQRREYDTGTSSWGDWIDVPAKEITTNPAPASLIWRNTQAELQGGGQYQWQARIVSLNGTESDWSDPLGITVTDDPTPPNKPTITVNVLGIGILLNFSPITQGGSAVKGEKYYKVEGKKSSGSWEILSDNHTPTWYLHQLPDSAQSEQWQYRVTAYNNLKVASTVSDITSSYSPSGLSGNSFTSVVNDTLAQVAVNEGSISLKVDKAGVVNAINISTEGIRITSSKLSISGSTEFSAGYNPVSKLEASGGRYTSAASGARVRIFPDDNTGIQVTDGTNDVFKVMVGGADAGDVIIGSTSGEYIKWDKSAGTLRLKGLVDTALGESISDQDRVRLGKVSGVAQLAITGGGVDCGYLASGSAGTGYPRPELWMKRKTNIQGQPISEVTLNPRQMFFEYDSVVTLTFDNDSKINSGPELSTIARISANGGIWASQGINITGPDSGMMYLGMGGTQVLGPQGAAVADATDAASTMARLNDLLARCRAHGFIAT